MIPSPHAPSSPAWTPSQTQAIQRLNGSVAVSASAGSGKTAVLTERVISLLQGGNAHSPARIEQLLLITFTEKAARQMRERIEGRLRRHVLQQGDQSRALREALDGLAGAWIMTIDAFCRRLVLEHFHRLQLPPAPRLIEGAELTEWEINILREFLGEALGGRRREAVEELLGLEGGGEGLIRQLRRLIDFFGALDRPEDWLARVRQRLAPALDPGIDLSQLPEARAAGESFRRAAGELAEALRELINQTKNGQAKNRGPGENTTTGQWSRLAEELEAFAGQEGPFNPDAYAPWLDQAEPILGHLANKSVCGPALYADRDFVDGILKPFSNYFQRHWRRQWFFMDQAGLVRGARLAARQCLALLDLAQACAERIESRKRRLGLVTFNDYERCALRILSEPGAPGPSEIARQLQEQFQHVLVDEYQDISPLQDAIIRRVARLEAPWSATQGNLFIVGDYKQSIYAFRDADPRLFLEKLQNAADPIHLPDNFRSRPGVIHFINSVFERLMDRTVGEVDYCRAERLTARRPDLGDPVCGPVCGPVCVPVCVEVCYLPKAPALSPCDTPADLSEAEREESNSSEEEPLTGMEAQAAWVARRIRELTDPVGGLRIPAQAAPPGAGEPLTRLARPGDCAIILRGLVRELAIWVGALEREGLKVRCPGANPLFTAPDLIDLMNALRVADNPFQDVALASLLRSPLARVDTRGQRVDTRGRTDTGGFDDNDLLRIRLCRPEGPFFDALWVAAGRPPVGEEAMVRAQLPEDLRARLDRFMRVLDNWRALARQKPAEEVLDAILRDTHYEAWLLGHEDGAARLERLDFLRGLLRELGRGEDARDYGGANPLASFLELAERAREETRALGDLPEPAATGDDAVSLLTIHKSKGLEFPIVFLPRLERRFEHPDQPQMLLDREGGLARPGVDVARRRCWPTLACAVLADARRRRERSEELRLLYVAMTRARERLVLVGQMKDPGAGRESWRRVPLPQNGPLPALRRLYAASPLDLLGPIIEKLRMDDAAAPWLMIHEETQAAPVAEPAVLEGVERAIRAIGGWGGEGENPHDAWAAAVDELQRHAGADSRPELRLLSPLDPARALTSLPAKMTVTQIRKKSGEREPEDWREAEAFQEEELRAPFYERAGTLAQQRPDWERAGGGTIDSLLRGNLVHAFMERLDLNGPLDEAGLRAQARSMLERRLLAGAGGMEDQVLDALRLEDVAWFLNETDLGQELARRGPAASRELPFTAAKTLHDFDPEAAAGFPDERIIVQGIADAVIDQGAEAIVIDYKTDYVKDAEHLDQLKERYRLQILYYARSLRAIWQLKKIRAALVFLRARRIEWLE